MKESKSEAFVWWVVGAVVVVGVGLATYFYTNSNDDATFTGSDESTLIATPSATTAAATSSDLSSISEKITNNLNQIDTLSTKISDIPTEETPSL